MNGNLHRLPPALLHLVLFTVAALSLLLLISPDSLTNGWRGLVTSNDIRSLFRGHRIFVLTHEVTTTGAPGVCIDFATLVHDAGAHVTFSVLPEALGLPRDEEPQEMLGPALMVWRLAGMIQKSAKFPLDVGASFSLAATHDIIIVSTASPHQVRWIKGFRNRFPHHAGLIWWVHEGESVMRVFGQNHTAESARLMTDNTLDGVIFPSPYAQAWWMETLKHQARKGGMGSLPFLVKALPWGLPSWRAKALVPDVDENLQRRREEEARNTLRISPDAVVFLVSGSYHQLKGHRAVVMAFKRMQRECTKKVFLLGVGPGLGLDSQHFPQPDMEWVLGDPSLRFDGPSTEISSYLKAADVYVSNTRDGGETWGLSTLEALFSAKPVLSSAVGGALDMLKHNVTALLHSLPSNKSDPDGEWTELAKNMCSMVEDDNLRQRLASHGHSYATTHLSHEYVMASLVDAFAGVNMQTRRRSGNSRRRGGKSRQEQARKTSNKK
jgi:glycosyltransferase involved in cell wall biosynthesis